MGALLRRRTGTVGREPDAIARLVILLMQDFNQKAELKVTHA
jgi:hypothetical protein